MKTLTLSIALLLLISCSTKQYYTVTEKTTVKYNLIDPSTGKHIKGTERKTITEDKIKTLQDASQETQDSLTYQDDLDEEIENNKTLTTGF